MKFRARFLSGALSVLLFAVPAAHSQVVVYKLEFEKTGKTINYSFYDEGYVVAPAAGGSPSYLFTFRSDTGMNQYTKFVDFGEYFMAVNESKRRAVLAADADSEVNLFALQAIGDTNIKLRVESVGFVTSVETAITLEGYVLSSDDESELPFDTSVGNLGYAGVSKLKASLQRERTDRANRDLKSVADTLADLEADLQLKGFTEFVLGAPDDATTPEDGTVPDDGTVPPTDGTDGTVPDDGTVPPTDGTLPDGGTGTDGEVIVPAVPIDDTGATATATP